MFTFDPLNMNKDYEIHSSLAKSKLNLTLSSHLTHYKIQ